MAIKWSKDDVIKKFQEAMKEPETGGKSKSPFVLQNLIDKAKLKVKGKSAEGEVNE